MTDTKVLRRRSVGAGNESHREASITRKVIPMPAQRKDPNELRERNTYGHR